MADDSGLEVDALNGAPGVRSARFAADVAAAECGGTARAGNSTDEANRRALRARLLTPGGDARRSARFRCALALANPSGHVVLRAEGVVEGRIVTELRGAGGFGYDPMFVPVDGDGSTFAEMETAAKAAISHRGRALAELLGRLRTDGWPEHS